MKNLNKAFDKKFWNNACVKSHELDILDFIRQREKKLQKDLLAKWDSAITYSDKLDGSLDKKIMENHFLLADEGTIK